MSQTRSRSLSVALLYSAVVLLSGCGDSANVIGPKNQLEVTAATDQFQLQLTALDQVTDSRSYDWQNTGAKATIDVSQEITGGSATVIIRDADGTVVYQSDVADDGDGITAEGTPGTWEIKIVLKNTTGTFNFRLQKVT
ncbi:hypothetical protein ACFL6X_03400 [Candidatus Latescibacterota bacterium]